MSIDSITEKPNQQQHIIQAAFTEWGKTHFANTSLSLVARALGITKQALYRHFDGKEALITAMSERFLTDFAQIGEALGALPQEAGLERIVRVYIKAVMGFYAENPYYYLFVLLVLFRRPRKEQERLEAMVRTNRSVTAFLLKQDGYAVTDKSVQIVAYYVDLVAFVWSALAFWTPTGTLKSSSVTEEEVAERVEQAVRICRDGLVCGMDRLPDFDAVERESRISPQEMPTPDRIFTAIEAAVAEEGIEQATVERIAGRAGISKSSLYFYFKNKDEMLTRMAAREHERFKELYDARIGLWNEPPEQLYCFMFTTVSYFSNNTSMMTVLDWLRFQKIRVQFAKPSAGFFDRMFIFLEEAVERGTLRIPSVTFQEVTAFLRIAVTRMLFDFRPPRQADAGADSYSVKELMRMTYRLLTEGIRRKE